MCLIIASPNGITPPLSLIHRGWFQEANDDGWGISWYDTNRQMDLTEHGFDIDRLMAIVPLLKGHPHIIHLRYGTQGVVSLDNCHPFAIPTTPHPDNPNGPARTIQMFHNGSFNLNYVDSPDFTKSDSWHMARFMNRLGITPESFDDPDFIRMLNRYFAPSRAAFMLPGGDIRLINASHGIWRDHELRMAWKLNEFDLWLSNDQSTWPMITPRQPSNIYSGQDHDPVLIPASAPVAATPYANLALCGL